MSMRNHACLLSFTLCLAHSLMGAAADIPAESPFVPYLRGLSGGKEGTDAELLLDGEKIFKGKEKTREERAQSFLIEQFKLTAAGGVAAVETVVRADRPEFPYVISMFSVHTGGQEKDLQLSYPLDVNFEPMTWVFESGKDDYRCDLLLYDRRLDPALYDTSYGINKIPQNKVAVKAGAPVMLVRILYASQNLKGFKTHPVIRSDGTSKRLVVPLLAADPRLRVLFYPMKYQQDSVAAIQNADFSKTTLRFRGCDDVYHFTPTSDNFMLASVPAAGEAVKLGFGVAYAEPPEPKGKLIAEFDFGRMAGNTSGDSSGACEATIEDGRLVDGGILGGSCLYLGQRREFSKAKIIVPKSIRQKFDKDQFTLSAWLKVPWGQLGTHDLVYWPYRRGAEGLEKPFASPWNFGTFGDLNLPVSRWDGGDNFRVGGFKNKFFHDTSVTLKPPGWRHVAVTGDKDQVRFYFNGSLAWEVTTPSPMTLASFRNGGDMIFMANFWGMLGKLRIHDFALSEKQIAAMIEKDLPSTLLHYSMDSVTGDLTPCVPSGDFPVDAWDWNARDFKKEVTFAAEVGAAKVVEGRNGKGLQLDGQGVIFPTKALMDLGINRLSVAFWFKPESEKGTLLSSRGHPKHGFNIGYGKSGIGGFLCGNYQAPAVKHGIPADGAWHHFVFCYDNYELRMFLDGKLLKKEIYIPNLTMNLTDGLAVGQGVKGIFDDIRIFNRMIGETEAKEMFDGK